MCIGSQCLQSSIPSCLKTLFHISQFSDMFRPDLQAIFRESFMTYVTYVSTYPLEFSHVIKLLLYLLTYSMEQSPS